MSGQAAERVGESQIDAMRATLRRLEAENADLRQRVQEAESRIEGLVRPCLCPPPPRKHLPKCTTRPPAVRIKRKGGGR